MSWSTSEAITDPAIREPMTLRSEFRFQLRDIATETTFRLHSHLISVPSLDQQAQATGADETQDGEVLQNVMGEFVCVYNAAVAKGMKPDPLWLEENPDFRENCG
jgi:hypothetical protein